MELFKIIFIALIGIILIVILKSLKREDISLFLIIIISITIFTFILLKLTNIVDILNNLIDSSGINKGYLTILLKVTGISYIIELASSMCKDAGVLSIGTKLEMLGKVSIIVLTIPIFTSVIDVILNVMKGNLWKLK